MIDPAKLRELADEGGPSELVEAAEAAASTIEELERKLREKTVDSVGTCARCGYTGPGPYHDCAAALFAQLQETRTALNRHVGYVLKLTEERNELRRKLRIAEQTPRVRPGHHPPCRAMYDSEAVCTCGQ